MKELDGDLAGLLWKVIQSLDLIERKWHQDNPAPKADPPPT